MDQLWTESQKPRQLRELDYHPEISQILQKLSQNTDFPHLLFYGPNGAGKKTRIMAFLREVYGQGVYSVQAEEKEYKISDTSNTTTCCTVLSSKYHIDVAPCDAEGQDKVIVQKLIKEVASSHQVNSKIVKDFKVVIINEIDNLTKEAQASLRRTMEKYIERCRIILTCESLARVIHPIRSRCLLIRVPSPTDQNVVDVLMRISRNMNFNLPEYKATEISKVCKGNLREAILCLQSQKMEQYPFKENQKIEIQEWKVFIKTQIVESIIKSQTPECLKDVREKFYQLLINCIPADRIIVVMLEYLLESFPNQKNRYNFIEASAICENRARLGSKSIVHLESLAAKYMVILKQMNIS